ncbi:MAG: hypothetical protein ACI8Z1_001831, partial [Candidatus Azotimanducaceae bacterium]
FYRTKSMENFQGFTKTGVMQRSPIVKISEK